MANNKKQVAETILRYTVDERSVRNAMAANEDIEDLFGKTSKAELTAADAAKKINQQFAELARAKAIGGITDETIRLANETGDWSKALASVSDELSNIGASASEIERVADALAEAQDSASRIDTSGLSVPTSGGGGANRLDTLDRLGSAGSQILGGLGQGEAANVAGLIGDAVSATSLFGPAAAGVTIALGAATAAVSVYTNALEKSAERAGTYSDAVQQAFEAGTSAQINALIQQQENDLQVLEATRGALEDKASEARDQLAITLDDTSENLTNFLNNLAGAPTDYSQFDLETSLEGYQRELGNVNADLDIGRIRLEAYRDILEGAGVATSDAEAAAAEAAAARDRQVQIELSAAQEAEALTSEGRRERIQSLIQEREQLQAAAEMEGISADYKAQLLEQTDELNLRINVLSQDMDTAADSADRLAQAQAELKQIQENASEATDMVFEANTKVTEAYKSALEATNAYNKSLFEHEAALNEIETNTLAKREELQSKADEDLLKSQAATQKKILDITKKTNATLSNAIAARDVLTYIMAKESQKDQLQQEEDSYKEREKELQATLRQQLADQDKANREAINRENQRWEQERQLRVRANQQAIADTQNAENAQRAVTQNSNVAQLALMEYRATGEASVYQRMASTAAFYLTYMENRNAAAWQAMATAITSTSSLGGGGTTRATPTAFADGGDVTRTGLALVHEGERIYTPIEPAGRRPLPNVSNVTNTAGGITINAMGSTRAQIRAQVYEELESAMSRAGLID